MDVRLPDGTVVRNVPDGTTKADLVAKLKSNGVAVPSEWLDAAPPVQASQAAGSALREIPRQVGLYARSSLEGLGGIADIVAEPLRQLVVNPAARAAGLPTADRSVQQLAAGAADVVGLPTPQNADERVVSDIVRTGTGAAGLAGGAKAIASKTGGMVKQAAQTLSARPGVQIAGGAGSGAAGGSVREAGGSDLDQFLASLGGGIAGGSAAAGASRLAGAAARTANALTTPKAQQLQAADQQISLTLERSGVDWSQVPERVRQGMRDEVAAALNTGQPLNPDALRRLLAFRSTGTTPTVGMLTQDPALITREMNLAKTGANSISPGLQRLPAIQNANTNALLSRLDEAGAANAPNAFATGQRVINGLQMRQDAAQNAINDAYTAARATTGRNVEMNGAAFTGGANMALDEAMVGGAVPPGVANTMNRIARGETPFTVDIAEQLKTQIGKLQRATSDGQQRYALGIIRKALDETPIVGAERVNPGNLPAGPGTVPPSVGGAGAESLRAFGEARRANAAWMRRVEANPALQAVVDGVEPDQFVSRYIINKGATARDLQMLRQEVGPEATQAIRQYIVSHLKDAATNSTDDVAKFSNDSYRRTLRNLGDEKLAAFFSPEEIQQLRTIGDAAKYMQAQPAGSAVNNSNSGALVLGRGLDMLDSVANYVPLGGRDIIKGFIQGRQQSQVLAPQNALVTRIPDRTPNTRGLLGASLATPVEAREDNRRNK